MKSKREVLLDGGEIGKGMRSEEAGQMPIGAILADFLILEHGDYVEVYLNHEEIQVKGKAKSVERAKRIAAARFRREYHMAH
ncbi:hypothetical protein [Bacillus sp. 1P06AnD]|uniref:hypothetical protein n=1 Tax=Bacillus sp. 1P06AnD TaxID=3132208 RepID=UPI0039A16F44